MVSRVEALWHQHDYRIDDAAVRSLGLLCRRLSGGKQNDGQNRRFAFVQGASANLLRGPNSGLRCSSYFSTTALLDPDLGPARYDFQRRRTVAWSLKSERSFVDACRLGRVPALPSCFATHPAAKTPLAFCGSPAFFRLLLRSSTALPFWSGWIRLPA